MSEGQWKVESGKWKVKTSGLKLEVLVLGISFHFELFTLNLLCPPKVHA